MILPKTAVSRQNSPVMRRRLFHIVVVTSLLACAVAASGIWWRHLPWRGRAKSPAQTLARLATTPDDRLAEQLRIETTRDDAASQSLLVHALANDRPALRHAARDILAERLDRWRLMPAPDSTPRVTRLATELGQTIERFPEDSRPLAADLATQLLLWPIDESTSGQEQGDRLVADCVKILRSAGATRALADPRTNVTRQPDRMPGPASPDRLR